MSQTSTHTRIVNTDIKVYTMFHLFMPDVTCHLTLLCRNPCYAKLEVASNTKYSQPERNRTYLREEEALDPGFRR